MDVFGLLTWVSVLILTASGVWYSVRIWKRIDKPVVATFILMTIVLGLSYWMYWDKPNASLIGNPGNLSGLVNVVIILGTLLTRHTIDNTLKLAFNRLQKICLILGALIVTVWLITDDPTTCYLLMQGLALIAYFPTIVRLIKDPAPKDSYLLWASVLFGAFCSIPPTVKAWDFLGAVYLIRVIPSTALVVGLAEWKRRNVSAMTS